MTQFTVPFNLPVHAVTHRAPNERACILMSLQTGPPLRPEHDGSQYTDNCSIWNIILYLEIYLKNLGRQFVYQRHVKCSSEIAYELTQIGLEQMDKCSSIRSIITKYLGLWVVNGKISGKRTYFDLVLRKSFLFGFRFYSITLFVRK